MATLPDATRMGPVELNVRDLPRMVAFYRDALGMRVHAAGAREATLGSDEVLLRLHHEPDARPRAPRQAGLFHVAYLVPTRADLGAAIRHLVDARVPLDGASDHLVSEALYLTDPEGNGIEVYRDRPRAEWPFRDGRLAMATEPMDVRGVLSEAGEWRGIPAGTRVGHVHLQVTDVPPAERYYADALGLTLMARYGAAASFLSAGGYHHHVAVNAWGTQGGAPASDDALGLRALTIEVPDKEALDEAAARVPGAEWQGGSVVLRDPSGNRVRLVG